MISIPVIFFILLFSQAKKTFEVRKREMDVADDNYMKQRLVVTQQKELDKV